MEKVSEITIQKLAMSGFKGHKEPVAFEFGDLTLISGEVRTGKTTVAEAIAFAFVGQGFWGGHNLDRLYNEENPDITVTLWYADGERGTHELCRQRKNDKTTISLDGNLIRQADCAQMFGERDEFLSLFNPLYFIQTLGEQGRELLEKHLPPISREAVLGEMNEINRFALQNEAFASISVYLKKLRDEGRMLQESKIAYEGQLSLLERQEEQRREQSKAMHAALAEVEQELRELRQQKDAAGPLADLQQQYVELTLRYDELQADAPGAGQSEELERQMQDLAQQLGQRRQEAYQSKLTDELRQIGQKITQARDAYQRLKKTMAAAAAGKRCPTCFRAITAENLPQMQGELKSQMEEVAAAGRQLKEKQDELLELDAKCETRFLEFQQQDVAQKQAQLAAVGDKLKEKRLELEEKAQALRLLQRQIDTVDEQIALGGLSPAQAVRMEELAGRQKELSAALEALEQQEPREEARVVAARKDQLEDEIQENRQKIEAALDFADKRSALLFNALATPNVRFKLYEVVKKTGEFRSVFKCTFKNRDYHCLSHSEMVEAGVELTGLLRTLTGRRYPVFIDDGESLGRMPRPGSQCIMARVVHGAALSVKSLRIPQPAGEDLQKAG